LEELPFVHGRVKLLNDQEVEVIVDEASTAMPQLVEWAQAKRLTVETIEEKSPPFDDVFVKIIERETAHV
jgi:acylphosphatase